MELMYRQIFMPDKDNIKISVPNEWKGMNIEVIAFPVYSGRSAEKRVSSEEKRVNRNALLDKYLIDLSNFRFNRDDANDYE